MQKRHIFQVVNIWITRVRFFNLPHSYDVMFPKKSQRGPDIPPATALTETPNIPPSHGGGGDTQYSCNPPPPKLDPLLSVKN